MYFESSLFFSKSVIFQILSIIVVQSQHCDFVRFQESASPGNRICSLYGHGHCAEVLLHPAVEYEWPALVKNGAKSAIGFGEKGGFDQAGFIFESQKFHGIAMFGIHDLAGNQQTGNAYMSAYKARQVPNSGSCSMVAISLNVHGTPISSGQPLHRPKVQ